MKQAAGGCKAQQILGLCKASLASCNSAGFNTHELRMLSLTLIIYSLQLSARIPILSEGPTLSSVTYMFSLPRISRRPTAPVSGTEASCCVLIQLRRTAGCLISSTPVEVSGSSGLGLMTKTARESSGQLHHRLISVQVGLHHLIILCNLGI